MIPVDCEHCFHAFEVADSLAGGLVNCPRCAKATAVPGLRDAWFRLVQAGMVVGWAVVTALGWTAGGLIGALIAGAAAALVLGLVYVSM